MTYQTTTNNYSYSRWYVDNVNFSPFTTVQAAINNCNAAGGGTVVVRPGTYVENLTLYDGVNLEGATSAEASGVVTITGTHTPPNAGTISMKRIRLLTPVGSTFNSAAAGTANIYLESCSIGVTNGFLFNLPNWTGNISCDDCSAGYSTQDGFLNNTGGSAIEVYNSILGAGAVNTMVARGNVNFNDVEMYCAINFQNFTTLLAQNCTFNRTVTFTADSRAQIYQCVFNTGAFPAITQSSTGTIVLSDCTMISNAVPVIGGAGTGAVTYGSITYTGNTGSAGTLTKDYTTRVETGVLKIDDADNGPLYAITGVVDTTGAMTNGQLVVGSTGAAPVNATLTPGTGITVVNAAGSITVNAVGGGLTWTNVGASTPLLVNNGFIANAGAALSFSLPAASAVGDVVALTLDGAASWTITQGANQQIRLGSLATTLGAGGSLASTASGDTVVMVCRTANTLWTCYSVIGNITVV